MREKTNWHDESSEKVAIKGRASAATAGQRGGTVAVREEGWSAEEITLPARALSVGRRDAVFPNFWRRALRDAAFRVFQGF